MRLRDTATAALHNLCHDELITIELHVPTTAALLLRLLLLINNNKRIGCENLPCSHHRPTEDF
jgi:hypothetical protein